MYRGLTNLFPKKLYVKNNFKFRFYIFKKDVPSCKPPFFPWFGEIPWFSHGFPMEFPKASAPRPAPLPPAPRPVPPAPRRAWCWRCRKRRNRTSRATQPWFFWGRNGGFMGIYGDLWGFIWIGCWGYLVGGDWNHGVLWISHHIGNNI